MPPGGKVEFSWEAAQLAKAWANGEFSHHNLFMEMEASPEDRVQTMVAVARADAAEVVKYSALAQALANRPAERRV